MTIHSGHPFPQEDDPLRRLRGRLGGAVAIVAAGEGAGRVGLTVSSLLVAAGEPALLLALIDPDSALADALEEGAEGARCVVSLLTWEHRDLAEAFAGLAPAPGGLFRTGGRTGASWTQTPWGPVLDGALGWAGVSVRATADAGWSLLVTGELDEIVIGPEAVPLTHYRGRYRPGPSAD